MVFEYIVLYLIVMLLFFVVFEYNVWKLIFILVFFVVLYIDLKFIVIFENLVVSEIKEFLFMFIL